MLSLDKRRNIRAATEALATEVDLVLREATNVLHVNALPKPTGAVVRVTVGPTADFTAEDLQGISQKDLIDLGSTYDAQMRAVGKAGGPELIESFLPTIEHVAGIASIAWSYRRKSSTGIGSFHVTQYKIPTSRMLVEFTTSYRESDAKLWSPIIQYVTASLRVPD